MVDCEVERVIPPEEAERGREATEELVDIAGPGDVEAPGEATVGTPNNGVPRWVGGIGVVHKTRSVYAGARFKSSVVLP
jgi:hypothetical protein